MAEPMPTDRERGTDAPIDSHRLPANADRSLRWGAYLFVLSGIGLIANGLAMLYRAVFAPGFESGVGTLGGLTRGELAAINHEVAHYIDHLHVNVAGLMIAVGVAVIALAWFGIRRGQRWAWATAVALPAVFLAHSLPVHQTAGFTFDAVAHLGPGIMWVPALLVGTVLAYRGLRSVDGTASADRVRSD
ncbi:hypothetical protein [Natrinema amylolyticum]|uniref:hypothetical protein n=1 Tax=Natrinema amylolyticum TaxID=2878679 RepID=UPI001CF92FB2|nr:hypothetical protein [Natrinema amylolyticum]